MAWSTEVPSLVGAGEGAMPPALATERRAATAYIRRPTTITILIEALLHAIFYYQFLSPSFSNSLEEEKEREKFTFNKLWKKEM